jgi:hypothetical protein
MNSKSTDAREPLLKDHRPTYNGTSYPTASSSLLEAGQRAVAKRAEVPLGNVRTKQVVASIGIILSGGAKIVHMVLQLWRAHGLHLLMSYLTKLCYR